MEIDWGVVATIAAPIIALIVGATLDHYFGKKSKLIAYVGHLADFRVRGDKGTTPVYTHSLVIRNAGRKTATNVRLGHYAMPPNYHISPAIDYEIRDVPETGPEIFIPKLVPNEQISISYLYFEPVTADRIHSYLKSDDGFAKVIPVITQQQFPKWVGNSILILAVIGVIALLYSAYTLFW